MLGAPPDQVADPLNGPRSLLAEGRPDTGRLEKLVGDLFVVTGDGVGFQLFHRV